MTNNQTIVIVTGLIFYFSIFTLIMGFVEADSNVNITTNSSDEFEFCKNPPICTQHTFFGNLINNVQDMPLWADTLFLVIPFALLIIFSIILIIHG